ncbi:MAG: penicillin-binding protein 1A [Gammaproteobacteria bacterium]
MLRFVFLSLLFGLVLMLAGAAGVVWYILPQLPPVESLREVRLQTPLKVFTSDGRLIAEFGEKRRAPVTIEAVPPLLKQAVIAAEDDRFYEHPGVDWLSMLRAVLELAYTHEKKQGGSTITMQVARNFFLSPEKTYERKLKEVVLAYIIERELTKDEILELYLNKIFLGHRAYGVGAAAQVYYGVTLDKLDLAQMAMIAGLPKAPSKVNPITDPVEAKGRRSYVLGRMLKLGFIDRTQYTAALDAPINAQRHGQAVEVQASHIAEMVRDYMFATYGDAAYTSGYRVYTTVPSKLQLAGNAALLKGLFDYDRRHGYRGPEAHVDLAPQEDTAAWHRILTRHREVAGLAPAVVLTVQDKSVLAYHDEAGVITLPWDGLKWARKHLSEDALGPAPSKAGDLVKRGDIIRVRQQAPSDDPKLAGTPAAEGYWALDQVPAVEGALVSLDPSDGKVLALVGGLDFEQSKFNRVTQARRQPGSNFKPFIYSAAFDKGYTAASFVNDAPIVFETPGLENAWRPENYSGNYFGPMRLREALTKSRNLVSIRLLRAIGVDYALNYVERFGFKRKALPANLSLALGTGEVTPFELVRAYAVLANGGYRVDPYFVARIESEDGQVVFEAQPPTVCPTCEALPLDVEGEPDDLEALRAQEAVRPAQVAPRTVAAENVWILDSILQDVIRFGTATRARALARKDLAGKTGTTNDQKDAWFSGFNPRIVTTVWVGFDRVAPLGRRETGAQAALPMWMDYMRDALADVPETELDQPPGVVTVRIDPDTGLLVGAGHPNSIFESFRAADVPARGDMGDLMGGDLPGYRGGGGGAAPVPEQIF